MSSRPKTSARAPATLDPSTDSSYLREHQAQVAGRRKRTLGEPLGITHYGVNPVELEPGAWSSRRHWHSAEDAVNYPDIDMQLTSPNEGRVFQHRDGRPYGE
jgi:uncharacterized cupin superfamily protein